MNYNNINLRYLPIYVTIIGIAMLLVRNEFFDVDERIILFPAVILCSVIFSFQLRHSENKRVTDLERYSKNENYDFLKEPSGLQLDDFRSFKTLRLIRDIDKGDDSFMNLLIQKSEQELNYIKEQKIVTVMQTNDSRKGGGFYTQVFLFKTTKEFPSFYLTDRPYFRILEKIFGTNLADMNIYEEINIEKYNFPKTKYSLYGPNQSIKEFFNREFIDLLNEGVKGKKRIKVESNGKDIIFYVIHKRHSEEGMKFYTNLFQVLSKALLDRAF